MSLTRRDFLKVSGLGAGGLAAGACASPAGSAAAGILPGGGSPDVVVVGAGAFGGWTAYHLQGLGARVTLVDMYGPGNSRATSGDETRGVRTAYGERELWTRWASEAIRRWTSFDEEWGRPSGVRLFFPTGDLILRQEWDPFLTSTRETWQSVGVRFDVLDPGEVRYRYPNIDVEGMGVALFEPDAGVVRSRRACEAVAGAFQVRGGEVVIARADPGRRNGDRLEEVTLSSGGPLRADLFVFALGPWFGKQFPDLMGNRIRNPIGHVFYFGPPPGDPRWVFPNMPSFNFPGITGWPALGSDSRGVRVRTGGRPPGDPDLSTRYIPEEFLEQPRKFLEERLPGLSDAPLLETRACHYEFTASREWLVDRHPDFHNVWLAGGGNAEGFKFGPVLGEYIARRVLGDDPHPELAERLRISEETFDDPG